MVIGIDLRCLPTDGTAGSGVAHAARAVTAQLVARLGRDAICYLPIGASLAIPNAAVVNLRGIRRTDLLSGYSTRPCDLLFVPSGAVSPNLPVPSIPWVHDVDIFSHPEWFPQSWMKRQITTRLFLRGVKQAPHVFAVSEYTKETLSRLVPSIRSRITVTGEGGDSMIAEPQSAPTRVNMPKRFVLMLGTVEPRKNIPLICRIWPELVKDVTDVSLVIAGQDGWKTDEINRAILAAGPRVIRLTSVTDDERRALLRSAELVLVPSFSEGFGLVALESIQAGVPVIASNRGALPEVIGQGEWLLDPTDEHAWREQIRCALTDDAVRNEILNGQQKQKKVFSWEKTGEIILDKLEKFV